MAARDVLAEVLVRKTSRQSNADEETPDEAKSAKNKKFWKLLALGLVGGGLALGGASLGLAHILRRRRVSELPDLNPVPDNQTVGGRLPGAAGSRVMSTYAPDPGNTEIAKPLFQRYYSPSNPPSSDRITAGQLGKALEKDLVVYPNAGHELYSGVTVFERNDGTVDRSMSISDPISRPVAYHETGHGLDRNVVDKEYLKRRIDLQEALQINPFSVSPELFDKAFEAEIPAMAIENATAMAGGWVPPAGWQYDMMKKHIPISKPGWFGPDVPADVESIRNFMQQVRGTDNELGRRYQDYLRAQGVATP